MALMLIRECLEIADIMSPGTELLYAFLNGPLEAGKVLSQCDSVVVLWSSSTSHFAM